jgi:hypothetical protein
MNLINEQTLRNPTATNYILKYKEGVMEKLLLNYHLKLQEMCDCYLETDFVPEMQHMATAPPSDDLEEDAIKYLALAIMHAITEQAAKLSLKKKGDAITVTVKDEEKKTLPAPAALVFAQIIEIVRAILHIEEDKGKLPLSLGLRNGEVNMTVKVKREEGKESVAFSFDR